MGLPGKPHAAIDLGSNTARLLIARSPASGMNLLFMAVRRETTRLGAGLESGGALDPRAAARSLAVLESFARRICEAGADWTVAVGTGALREARDGAGFAKTVAVKTGLELNIVSQETEALLTLSGVSLVMGERDLAAVDIGGRSTEVAVRSGLENPRIFGFPLGVVELLERFIRHDPPRREEMEAVSLEARRILGGSDMPVALPAESVLAGTGGTFTCLAALDRNLAVYDRERINGYILRRARVEALLKRLASLDMGARSALPGMEPGRADVIIPGAVAVLAVMDRLGRSEATISDAGILEGCLIAGLSGELPLRKTLTEGLHV